MADRPLRVGDHVILLSGTFKDFDGNVEQIDTDAGKLVVGLILFGNKTLHEFDLASIAEHVAPFGDVPPVSRYPGEESKRQQFQRLLEACRFWQLPYDDGRRYTRRRFFWELEGYDDGRFHRVDRITEDPVCEISECCQYLENLAPELWDR